MSARSIDSQILKFLPLLEQDEKKSILTVIKSFLKHKDAETRRPTTEEYNQDIDDALKRVNDGEFYTQEEVEKMSKNW